MYNSPPPPRVASQGREDIDVQRLYEKRFEKTCENKRAIWKVLCRHFFQRFVPEDAAVTDIAAGNCEFINNIAAREKTAFDLNPDVEKYTAPGVRAVNASFFEMARYVTSPQDIIFASNILEHLADKEEVLAALRVCYENLAPDGRLLILQPDIKYVKGAYWDFIDHKVPLTSEALVEAGGLTGFRTVFRIKRFLPYTTRSRLPQHPVLVWLYLALPLAWRLLGKQGFLVMEKANA